MNGKGLMALVRSWAKGLAVSVVAVLAGLASGCATQSKVPKDASLIYLGPPNGAHVTPALPSGASGQLYVVDDRSGRLVAVRLLGPGVPALNLDLDERRKYRAYFRVAGPTTVPTTAQSQ